MRRCPTKPANVGQFTMGNEPSLHIPYLYNYAGAPWKTQRRIRSLLATFFGNDLMGIPGDEDGGGLTFFRGVLFDGLLSQRRLPDLQYRQPDFHRNDGEFRKRQKVRRERAQFIGR